MGMKPRKAPEPVKLLGECIVTVSMAQWAQACYTGIDKAARGGLVEFLAGHVHGAGS